MKNKKGFTLTELIAVIAVLSIIMGMCVAVVLNVRDNVLKQSYENVVSLLETEAANYAKDTGITTVTVEELITSGYVLPDDETDIYNPVNNESLNCYIINSSYENGEYVSTFGEDIGTTSGTCNTYEKEVDLQICKYDEEMNTCKDFDSDTWFSNNITLGIKYRNGEILKDENLTYIWSSVDGSSGDTYFMKTNTSLISQGAYTVKVSFEDNKVSEANKEVKIDKQAPIIVEAGLTSENEEEEWAKEKSALIVVSDYAGSGAYGVFAGKNGEFECTKDLKYTKVDAENKATVKLVEGENKICIIDNAGNINDGSNGDESFNINNDKVDNTAADWIKLEKNTENYAKNVILTGTAQDSKSGLVAYQFTTTDNITENSSGWISIDRTNEVITQNYTATSNGTYYFWVKDAVGNVNVDKVSIKIDNIDSVGAESISLTSNTSTYTKSLTLTGKATDTLSGIVKYQITTSSSKPSSGWTTTSAKSSVTATKTISSNGTYYFWIEDAVGNTSKASIKINNIDNSGPTLSSGGRVSLGSVTTAVFTDPSTPIKVYYYVSTSSSTPSPSKITSTSRTFSYSCGNTYYVWAKAVDALGNYTVVRLGSVYGGACCSVGTYRYDYCDSWGYEVYSRYNGCTGRTEYLDTTTPCESDWDCGSWGSCKSNNKKTRTCYYYYGGREYRETESKRCTYSGGSSGGSSSSGNDDKPDRYEANRECSNSTSSCSRLGYSGGGVCEPNSGSNSVCGSAKYICYCCNSRDYLGQKIEWNGRGSCVVV